MVIGRDTIPVHIINTYTQFPATGGGGGGSPPAGITPPNQVYTAISNGGAVGFTVHTIGINHGELFAFPGTPPQIISPFGGNQTTNASMAITDLTNPAINNGEFTIRITHTMPASAFNSLIGTGFTTSGGSAVQIDETFFLFGWYLESPNGTATIPQGDIDIMGTSANFTGMGLAAKTTRSEIGQIYSTIDSTSFTNAIEAFNFVAGPVSSNSSLGSNGVVTAGNTTQFVSGDTHCICALRNFAGRSGGSPTATAGQSMTIEFRIRGDVGGNPEVTRFLYELLLS